MCPACITTTALLVAGAGSAGGLTAFVVTKLHRKTGENAGQTGGTAEIEKPEPGRSAE
jgi:hypothetical protein